jgi:hypothetical protein
VPSLSFFSPCASSALCFARRGCAVPLCSLFRSRAEQSRSRWLCRAFPFFLLRCVSYSRRCTSERMFCCFVIQRDWCFLHAMPRLSVRQPMFSRGLPLSPLPLAGMNLRDARHCKAGIFWALHLTSHISHLTPDILMLFGPCWRVGLLGPPRRCAAKPRLQSACRAALILALVVRQKIPKMPQWTQLARLWKL